jgi:hypothetical protein
VPHPWTGGSVPHDHPEAMVSHTELAGLSATAEETLSEYRARTLSSVIQAPDSPTDCQNQY